MIYIYIYIMPPPYRGGGEVQVQVRFKSIHGLYIYAAVADGCRFQLDGEVEHVGLANGIAIRYGWDCHPQDGTSFVYVLLRTVQMPPVITKRDPARFRNQSARCWRWQNFTKKFHGNVTGYAKTFTTSPSKAAVTKISLMVSNCIFTSFFYSVFFSNS